MDAEPDPGCSGHREQVPSHERHRHADPRHRASPGVRDRGTGFPGGPEQSLYTDGQHHARRGRADQPQAPHPHHPGPAEERDHGALPGPDGRRAPQAVQGLSHPAQQRPGTVQGRLPLPRGHPSGRREVAGLPDDHEVRPGPRALRRRQGRREGESPRTVAGRAGAGDPAVLLGHPGPDRAGRGHPRAGRGHQRPDHGVVRRHLHDVQWAPAPRRHPRGHRQAGGVRRLRRS